MKHLIMLPHHSIGNRRQSERYPESRQGGLRLPSFPNQAIGGILKPYSIARDNGILNNQFRNYLEFGNPEQP